MILFTLLSCLLFVNAITPPPANLCNAYNDFAGLYPEINGNYSIIIPAYKGIDVTLCTRGESYKDDRGKFLGSGLAFACTNETNGIISLVSTTLSGDVAGCTLFITSQPPGRYTFKNIDITCVETCYRRGGGCITNLPLRANEQIILDMYESEEESNSTEPELQFKRILPQFNRTAIQLLTNLNKFGPSPDCEFSIFLSNGNFFNDFLIGNVSYSTFNTLSYKGWTISVNNVNCQLTVTAPGFASTIRLNINYGLNSLLISGTLTTITFTTKGRNNALLATLFALGIYQVIK